MLLAIDTATRFASLALYEPGQVLAEHTWKSGNNHSVEMMPSLAEMLERQSVTAEQLSAVAVAIGPGSFTGLRIGLAVAKGLVTGVNIPLIGIPTLDILPHAAGHIGLPNWSVIQAGRGRLCYAEYRYQKGAWRRFSDVNVGTLSDFISQLDGLANVCGEIAPDERKAINDRFGDSVMITPSAFSLRRAAFLADLAWHRLEDGEQDDLVTLSPIYLHQTTRASSK